MTSHKNIDKNISVARISSALQIITKITAQPPICAGQATPKNGKHQFALRRMPPNAPRKLKPKYKIQKRMSAAKRSLNFDVVK